MDIYSWIQRLECCKDVNFPCDFQMYTHKYYLNFMRTIMKPLFLSKLSQQVCISQISSECHIFPESLSDLFPSPGFQLRLPIHISNPCHLALGIFSTDP